MSNIKKAFENGKAFIAFITCGDPDLETTAAAVKAGSVESVPQAFDIGRISADQIISHFFNASQHGFAVTFEYGFAPAGVSVVCFDFHKSPSRSNKVSVHFGDLHRYTSLHICNPFFDSILYVFSSFINEFEHSSAAGSRHHFP